MIKAIVDIVRQVLGIVKWALVALVVGLPVLAIILGMDFVRSVGRFVSAPFSGIFSSSPKHDLKTPARVQQPALELDALATMIAYDSRGELTVYRPRVMREMGLVVLRIQAKTPGLTITGIVEGCVTWLPENWDPRKKSRGNWYNRELDRMRARLSSGELVDAKLIAEQLNGTDPGTGPIRYTRPTVGTIRQKVVSWWSNETDAAAQIGATMDLDTELAKLGIRTGFYRQRPVN